MFDLFSPSHLLIIAIAVIVFVGPKDLPQFMRGVGRWTGKLRGMAAEFRQSFEEMDRHEELRELREELTALKSARPQDFERNMPSPLPPALPAESENDHAQSAVPTQAEMAALS